MNNEKLDAMFDKITDPLIKQKLKVPTTFYISTALSDLMSCGTPVFDLIKSQENLPEPYYIRVEEDDTMYESPVNLYTMADEIQKRVNDETEQYIYEYVRNICVTVDKDELFKALKYDRDQYAKGYADGKRDQQSYWIDTDGMYACANCGGESGIMSNYCPDCGCKM